MSPRRPYAPWPPWAAFLAGIAPTTVAPRVAWLRERMEARG